MYLWLRSYYLNEENDRIRTVFLFKYLKNLHKAEKLGFFTQMAISLFKNKRQKILMVLLS